MPDSLRLALGTFTILPVPAPRAVDRSTARGAMLLAPVVSLLLGLLAAAVLYVVRLSPLADRSPVVAALLASALAIGALALLTRGLHLDGLADTADALGVKGVGEPARERRLAVMRTPELGAFGAITLVLVLVVQVLALAGCVLAGRGTVGLVAACVVSRLAITWACTRPVPSARPDGLGAAVAGTVPVAGAALLTAGAAVLATGLGLVTSGAALATSGAAVVTDAGIPALLITIGVGLAAGALGVRHAVRRFGGITGDVLGATAELALTAALLAAALLP